MLAQSPSMLVSPKSMRSSTAVRVSLMGNFCVMARMLSIDSRGATLIRGG